MCLIVATIIKYQWFNKNNISLYMLIFILYIIIIKRILITSIERIRLSMRFVKIIFESNKSMIQYLKKY